jgi:LuxR family maltose regulon positive regulatory protein
VFDRPELIARLAAAGGERVVALSAPAGYGKTTALSLWDEADPRAFAWVNLEPADDDAAHLLRHVALAVNVVEPLSMPVTRILGGTGRTVDADMLPALGGWLERRAPFVLVVDDVHHLVSPATCRCLERLIAFLPRGSAMALSGRSLGELNLARLRAGDRVVSIDTGDLAMSLDEARVLLANKGVRLDPKVLAELVRRTEGWPAGLHLAALAMAGREDGPVFSGRDPLVAEYLMEEVLGGLPAETVRFLERSAVPARMSAGLLDELMETDRAAVMLGALDEADNMFLVPLDRDGEWYRYHHLFGDMLRARLKRTDPDELRRLERRASLICERMGEVDAAVRHAANARDSDRVADLVLRHASRLVFQGEMAQLGRWLELLEPDAIHRLPAAALAWAWYGLAIGDRELIQRGVLAAERWAGVGPLADGSPDAGVAVAMVKAITALDGVAGVVRDTAQVRAAGSPATNPWFTLATVVRATALSMLGELDGAEQLLHEALSLVIDAPGLEAAATAHLALIELERGHRAGADQLASRALRTAERHNLDAVTVMIPVFAIGSLVAARHGRANEARRAANQAKALLARLDGLAPRTLLFGQLLLAQASVALDHRAEARVLADDAQRARSREPSATHLNEQLDELLDQLSTGTQGRVRDHATLTAAELRVLPLLPTHLSMQGVADQLLISRNTAKTHLVAIYRKLGVSSRAHAVVEAQRRGLLTA